MLASENQIKIHEVDEHDISASITSVLVVLVSGEIIFSFEGSMSANEMKQDICRRTPFPVDRITLLANAEPLDGDRPWDHEKLLQSVVEWNGCISVVVKEDSQQEYAGKAEAGKGKPPVKNCTYCGTEYYWPDNLTPRCNCGDIFNYWGKGKVKGKIRR